MIAFWIIFVAYSLVVLLGLLISRVEGGQEIIKNISSNEILQSNLNSNPCNDILVKDAIKINHNIKEALVIKRSIWGMFISDNVYNYKFIEIPKSVDLNCL